MNNLTIKDALIEVILKHQDKSLITEALLAKYIRESYNIKSKTKAVIALEDIEEALESLEDVFFSLHLNSAGDILLKKDSCYKPLSEDSRKRRLQAQGRLTLLRSKDLMEGMKSSKPKSHK